MNFKIKDEKIVGYALLIAGLCIIGFSLIGVIGAISGNIPIRIIEETGTTQAEFNASSGEMNFDMSNFLAPLYPFFNLMAWLAIMFFVLFAGARIARLGIRLMKVPVPDTKIVKPTKEEKKET